MEYASVRDTHAQIHAKFGPDRRRGWEQGPWISNFFQNGGVLTVFSSGGQENDLFRKKIGLVSRPSVLCLRAEFTYIHTYIHTYVYCCLAANGLDYNTHSYHTIMQHIAVTGRTKVIGMYLVRLK